MAGWLPMGVTQNAVDRAIEGGCPECGFDECRCWPLDEHGVPIPPDEAQEQPLTNPQGGLDFMANETEQQKAEREQREKEQREVSIHHALKEQRDREQKKESGEAGKEERVGNPMREDDRMNQFRAPDVKPIGAFYGEDTTQPRAVKPEEIGGLPPETHPQKPAKEAEPEEEEEDKQTVSRR